MAELSFTVVFGSNQEAHMRALCDDMNARYPFGFKDGATCVWTTGLACGDVMSVNDAIRSVADTSAIDDSDKVRLITELLGCTDHAECLSKLEQWELRMDEEQFELVSVPS